MWHLTCRLTVAGVGRARWGGGGASCSSPVHAPTSESGSVVEPAGFEPGRRNDAGFTVRCSSSRASTPSWGSLRMSCVSAHCRAGLIRGDVRRTCPAPRAPDGYAPSGAPPSGPIGGVFSAIRSRDDRREGRYENAASGSSSVSAKSLHFGESGSRLEKRSLSRGSARTRGRDGRR